MHHHDIPFGYALAAKIASQLFARDRCGVPTALCSYSGPNRFEWSADKADQRWWRHSFDPLSQSIHHNERDSNQRRYVMPLSILRQPSGLKDTVARL